MRCRMAPLSARNPPWTNGPRYCCGRAAASRNACFGFTKVRHQQSAVVGTGISGEHQDAGSRSESSSEREPRGKRAPRQALH